MAALSCACSLQPPAREQLRPVTGMELQLRLPSECEPWRSALESEARDVAASFARCAARWPAVAAEAPLRLVVARDPAEADALRGILGLAGGGNAARTWPARRLALLALPRSDPLLFRRSLPPLTWRETFRHEIAHLSSLDRPGLQSAPSWFQEGLAELLADRDGGRLQPWTSFGCGLVALRDFLSSAADPDVLALPVLDGAPGEARLAAWRWLAAAMMDESPQDPEPWRTAGSWTVARLRAALAPLDLPAELVFRGREVDPVGCARAEGRKPELFLASWPGETVMAVAAASWSGATAPHWVVEVGGSGAPEAGATLEGTGSHRVRLRFGRFGGAAAWLEPRTETLLSPFEDLPADGRIGGPREFLARLLDGELELRSGDWRQVFPLEPGVLEPPLRLEFYVRDGALRVELPAPEGPPGGHGL